ncbi:MAG: pitrilysin family protein [Patescibacteria group bacterium]|nr:pitrilysin family protein [Patescibacteria group bacterium]
MYKRLVRKDGTVIILLPKKETKAVTLELLYKVGSRQENPANNGASHFVEHLMFKGTHRRPNTADISRELDAVGAEYNAFTGKEYTGYYVTADSRHFLLAADILSDMLYNSKFEKQEIDRERGVIVEEINMYEDNPIMYIEDAFEELIFAETKLGQSIAGPRENIRNISRRALLDYYQKYYYNGNMVIGLAGKFDQSKALKVINQLFPLAKKKPRLKYQAIKFAEQPSPQIRIINKSSEQVQLMLGFLSPDNKDKKFLLSQLLANILGGSMSSRLFLSIRERKGLCYFIRSGISGYQDSSAFYVRAGLNKLKIYEALAAIREELDNFKQSGPDKDELEKAKENMRGRLILKMEESGNHLNFLLGQEIIGQKIKDVDQKLKELDKISASQVRDLARKVIDWRQSNLTIIGSFNQSDKNKFLNILNK